MTRLERRPTFAFDFEVKVFGTQRKFDADFFRSAHPLASQVFTLAHDMIILHTIKVHLFKRFKTAELSVLCAKGLNRPHSSLRHNCLM